MSGRVFNRENERKRILASSIQQKQINQLGLFGYTPHSVGDDSYFHKVKARKDDEGMVIINPRQCLPGPRRTSKQQSSYFQHMGTLAVGAKYLNPDKVQKALISKLQKTKPVDVHTEDPKFKPPGNMPLQRTVKGSYPHMKDYNLKYKKKTLNEEGGVLIGLKQIVTSPAKNGTFNRSVGHLFQKKYPEYMVDEYNRARKINTKTLVDSYRCTDAAHENAKWKRSRTVGRVFWNNQQTFNVNKNKFPKKRSRMVVKIEHESAIKLGFTGRSHNKLDTISKYPPYMGNPIRVVVRKADPEDKKNAFKQGYSHVKWKPCPSITSNIRNLRRMTRR